MSEYYLTKDELYHHGIKGQKWGLRRFQNEDGTYTNIGKQRRRIGSPVDSLTKTVDKKAKSVENSKAKSERLERRRKQADSAFKPGKDNKPSKAQKISNETRTAEDAVLDLDRAIRKRKNKDRIAEREKEIQKMSDAELQKKINRHRLENEYRKVIEEEEDLKQGRSKVQEFMDIAVPIGTLAASAVSIYAYLYAIKHGL